MAATALLAIALLHTASASLSIRARYRGADFLEHFDFFSADDPTHGWVDYLDRGDAMAAGLVDVADDGTFFMGAGRPKTAAARLPSVRIEGRHSIAGGLAVLDIEAVPVGCGAWPAFWMCNQTDPATAGTPAAWPAGGEIDVLEGVHLSRVSATTLHAGPGCTRKFKSAYAAPPYAGNERPTPSGGRRPSPARPSGGRTPGSARSRRRCSRRRPSCSPSRKCTT